MCGSPKTAKFKPPKKVSKVTLPDWLIKWQKLSNEQPPTQNAKKKLTLIIPPKQKEETSFPKSAKNSSKKIANPKAKKSESGQKKHHQSAKKIKDKNAEKITSQKTNPVPVNNAFNMFKMLPQAKFKLQKPKKDPPCLNLKWWQTTSKLNKE